jgi:phosphohistidine phosphatase
MKKLYLLRHAKSSWADIELTDHERPLNQRGEKDIPRIASWLSQKLECPELVLSSDSVRTKLTLKPVAAAWQIKPEAIRYAPQVYHASSAKLLKLLQEIDSSANSLLIVGHNPGLTDFANNLSKNYITDNLPTSGFIGLTFSVDTWQEVEYGKGKLLAYQYPKNL